MKSQVMAVAFEGEGERKEGPNSTRSRVLWPFPFAISECASKSSIACGLTPRVSHRRRMKKSVGSYRVWSRVCRIHYAFTPRVGVYERLELHPKAFGPANSWTEDWYCRYNVARDGGHDRGRSAAGVFEAI